MSRRLPPLNALRVFEAAARAESFSMAAEELCVTHGAVSRQVRQLEDWLGLDLFERRGRRVVLTASGRAYLAEVSAALDRIALATSEQLRATRAQIVRVNAPTTFALRWLLPQLSSFQLTNPAVEVRLTTSDEPIEKLGDECDVAIRGSEQKSAGYAVKEFLSEVRLPVCSPKVLESHPIRSVSDLAHHTLLHTATYPGLWAEWLAASGNPGLAARHSRQLDHFYLTLQAAIDGLGIAMGPTALVALDVKEGRLVFPFDGPALPAWRYCSYVREARLDDPAIDTFLTWLRELGHRFSHHA
ncbi:transcriptional regulator GcvA [Paraburkholderia sp. CNPSo 3274]|uniref:transcriptional regulator GcvA n=1 Tax=Paraburkholderia sp. CNPSo 3274 TaxID=2940932 RepID=UPI0020B858F9|nr:transcriptional regulator GcvA [Paraburkholderia sp. CNPSo 3274]MCP3706936.1 transcriptional regulator GcvA [Paraburkholderia sp. CNPSo 3274]